MAANAGAIEHSLPPTLSCKPLCIPSCAILVIMADSSADSEQADDPSNLTHCSFVKAHLFMASLFISDMSQVISVPYAGS